MKSFLLFLAMVMISTQSFAACTRAKLAGEYSASGVVLADDDFGPATVYVTGRFTLVSGGGVRVPIVTISEAGEKINASGSGGWGVNNNCVGFMNLTLRAPGVTGTVRIDFNAAGSGNDIVLSAVYTDDDEGESGIFEFRKRNL